MENLISIVIPMYNAKDYIVKLLDSIKRQTYQNLEIIIVNDGSTDHSLELVQDFSKKDVRIKIISTKNNGVSKARNIGLTYATGEYITFLDADDYICPEMYERIMEKMMETKVDVIRCNFMKEDTNGNILAIGDMFDLSNQILSQKEIREKLIPYLFENKVAAYTPLILAKASVIKKSVSFNEEIHMMEDLLFCLNLLLSIDTIYFYDYPCYHYLFHASSSSKARNNILRNFQDTLKVVNLVKEVLTDNQIDEKIFTEVYHVYSTMIVKYTLRTFQKEDEYQWSFEKMKKMLDCVEVQNVIKYVDFSSDSEYIKEAGKLIQNREYDKLYQYANSIKNILI